MSLRSENDPEDDPALEACLRTLSLSDRQPGPEFTLRVMANLPPQAVEAPAEAAGLLAWWRRQWSAGALVLSGLLVMLLTGDALAVLSSAWQAASDWVNTAASADAGALGSGLAAAADAGSPEAYLGVVVGALLLALGAGNFVLNALTSPMAGDRRQYALRTTYYERRTG